MLNYKQIWHEIKPIRWLNKFNLTKRKIVKDPRMIQIERQIDRSLFTSNRSLFTSDKPLFTSDKPLFTSTHE